MINLFLLFIVAICVAFFTPSAFSDQALQQTQSMLRDKKQREKAINELPGSAKQTDQNIDKIVGGDEKIKEEMYHLSADVMQSFEGKSVEEMQKILKEAQDNPEAFYKSLSAEQQKKIKQLSNQLEAKQKRP